MELNLHEPRLKKTSRKVDAYGVDVVLWSEYL